MQVRDVMTTTVVTVRLDTPFPDLVDTLLTHGVSGAPVVDDDGTVVGIVTEADLVSKEAYGGKRRRALEVLADVVAGGQTEWSQKGKGHTAAQVMTRPVLSARSTDSVRLAARRMVEHGCKRLPVIDDGRLVGIVSRTDLLAALHRSDDDLAGAVRALLGEPFHAPEGHAVEVEVQEGVVTLRGTVQFPDDEPVLRALAWSVPGVVDVQTDVTAERERPHRDLP